MVAKTHPPLKTLSSDPQPSPEFNTVAVIGLALIGVAGLLCLLMFGLAGQLPDKTSDFEELNGQSPTHLRLLILGCSTVVLVFVALILSILGLLLPNRRRAPAVIGTVAALAVLLGIFGVIGVGLLMNPGRETGTNTEVTPTTDSNDLSNVPPVPEVAD